MNFAALNAANLTAFAEPMIYRATGGDVDVEGIFEEAPSDENFGGAPIADKLYLAHLSASVAATAGIERKQTLSVRGVDYQILDDRTDLSDMTTLTLRRYT